MSGWFQILTKSDRVKMTANRDHPNTDLRLPSTKLQQAIPLPATRRAGEQDSRNMVPPMRPFKIGSLS